MEESVSTAKTDPVEMNLFCKATQEAASPDLLAIFRNLSNTRQTQIGTKKKNPQRETFLKVQFSQQPTPLHTALTHICVFCLHLGHGASRCRMSNTTPVALHSKLATGFCLSDSLFKNQEACVVLCACVHMYALCAPHAS